MSTANGLALLVEDFASALMAIDKGAQHERYPEAGIGPFEERRVVGMVREHLHERLPDRYASSAVEVPYPSDVRLRCDLTTADDGGTAAEVKALRWLRSKGGSEPAALNHILSPYPQDGSALTDCEKLARSGFAGTLAVLIYAYDYDDYPCEPVLEAFEVLARRRCQLGERVSAEFSGLIHPHHRRGTVCAWPIGE